MATCYNRYTRQYYYCRSNWNSWGRWVLLGVVLILVAIAFFLTACISARRRRKQGKIPMYGTGWAGSNQKYCSAPMPDSERQWHQQHNVQPPTASNPYPPQPAYTANGNNQYYYNNGTSTYAPPPGKPAETYPGYEQPHPRQRMKPCKGCKYNPFNLKVLKRDLFLGHLAGDYSGNTFGGHLTNLWERRPAKCYKVIKVPYPDRIKKPKSKSKSKSMSKSKPKPKPKSESRSKSKSGSKKSSSSSRPKSKSDPSPDPHSGSGSASGPQRPNPNQRLITAA